MSIKDDNSKDRQPMAPKKPDPGKMRVPKSRPAKTKATEETDAVREARLAEALRANLRRRKVGGDVKRKDE